MSIIEVYNTHCCGEIGDVIVSGDIKLEGETIFKQSQYLFENKKFLSSTGLFISRFNL